MAVCSSYKEVLKSIAADQADHTRIRKLFAHAFSDTALLEQEPILTHYFDLLVKKLNEQVDGPTRGRVDMMAYYNFTTFDIIGYVLLIVSLNTPSEVFIGI